ncbi:MAG: hypothetical protein AAF694_25475, partial [Bacteroidota bacterium]
CGRSGTSIFGELFDHLSGYTYHSEPPYESLAAFDWTTPQAIKVPRVSVEKRPDPGLPFPLEDLLKRIPEPRTFFWQVRHPLDTICSLKVGIAQNWGHHPRPEDWEAWQEKPLLQRCAHHWNYINTVGYHQVAHLVNICRFEDMLTDPLSFAIDICSQVEVDQVAKRIPFGTWADRVQDTNNEKFIEAQTSRAYSRPDHRVKIGRWKENLHKHEVEEVLPLVRGTAQMFGYALP